MSIVVVDQGEEQWLDLIIGVTMNLRLYQNDVDAGLTSAQKDALTESDFTECTFSGYSAKTISSGAWTTTQGNPSSATAAAQTFTHSGGATSNDVYGYYWTRDSDSTLIAYEPFPVKGSLVNSGDDITITPTFNLDDKDNPNVEPGMIVGQGTTTVASGWLACDGTAVSRTTYAELFNAIGTNYGSGDGSTTFNVPDLQQRFPLGKATSGTGSSLGATGGTVDHTHDLNGTGAAALHYMDSGGTAYERQVTGLSSWTRTDQHSITHASSSGTATTGVELAGATDTANPPYNTVFYVIKT